MSYYETLVRKILKESGAVFVAKNRHEKWRLPNGKIRILAVSPSDPNHWMIVYQQLCNELGLHPEDRGQPGERRVKKCKFAPEVEITKLSAPPTSSMNAMSQIKLRKPSTGKKIVHPKRGNQHQVQQEVNLDLDALVITALQSIARRHNTGI